MPKSQRRPQQPTSLYIVSSLILGIVCSLSTWALPFPRSTFVYPRSIWTSFLPVLLPVGALVLDTYILRRIEYLIRPYPANRTTSNAKSLKLLGVILMVSIWRLFSIPQDSKNSCSMLLHSSASGTALELFSSPRIGPGIYPLTPEFS